MRYHSKRLEIARPGADYRRSLQVLANSKQINSEILTKSALLLGLGEEYEEILQVMEDLYHVKCDILYLGQYLQPKKQNLPVKKY